MASLHQHYIPWLYNYSIIQPSFSDETYPNTHTSTNSQHQIGINQLPKGRISKQWTHLQRNNSTQPHPNIQDRWASNFVSLLWDLSLDLWNIRNNNLHNQTHNAEAAKVRWVNETVETYYSMYNNNSSGIPQHHFQTPLEQFKLTNLLQKVKWLQTIDLLVQPTNSPPNYFEYIHHRKHPTPLDTNVRSQNGQAPSPTPEQNTVATQHDGTLPDPELIRKHSYWDTQTAWE